MNVETLLQLEDRQQASASRLCTYIIQQLFKGGMQSVSGLWN